MSEYKLVPVEPTRAQWEAGAERCIRAESEGLAADGAAPNLSEKYTAIGLAVDVYTAMVAAAPESPKPPVADERAMFEAWAQTNDGNCSAAYGDLSRNSHEPEEYALAIVQAMWTTWQARASLGQSSREDSHGEARDSSEVARCELTPDDAFEAWWQENFAEATAQDSSWDEAKRCARVVWQARAAQPSEPVAWADLEGPAITRDVTTAKHWASAGRPITPLYAHSAPADARDAARRQLERGWRMGMRDAMDAIDKYIVPGDFGDDGCGKNAQRNGLVLAYNEVSRALAAQPPGAKT